MAPRKTVKTIDIDVMKALRTAEVSVLHLSDVTGIPRTTLRRKLLNPGTFTLNEYALVSAHLGLASDALKVAS